MKDSDSEELELTPELVLRAYGAGVFPMADDAASDDIYWVDPRKRGILPLNGFHLSRSLKRRLLREDYRIRIDTCFEEVLNACADRPETWINPFSLIPISTKQPKFVMLLIIPGTNFPSLKSSILFCPQSPVNPSNLLPP